MKKVLIVSDFFFPSTIVGAVRPSKIAQKLKEAGYSVDVFTRYPVDENEKKYCDNLYSFEQRTPSVNTNSRIPSNLSGINKFLLGRLRFLYKVLYRMKLTIETVKNDRGMLRAFKSFVKSSRNEYDAIFTTFGPLGSLCCGLYYKKVKPDVKWICDFRDPAVVSQLGFIRNFYRRIKEQHACRTADEIVAVSNGYLKRICGEKYKEKCHMIPNGYDKNDLVYSESTADCSGVLKLVYVGILYGQMRDITPVFRALRELAQEGMIDKDKVRFNYAGTDYVNMIKQAEQLGMADIVTDHGILPREKCLELQFSSDLLVLSTWNTKEEFGVFPGKLLEYMLIGKPIVTTVSGNLANSEVSCVIKEGNLGIVYEEVNSEKDLKALKEYLLNQYNFKILGKKIPFCPDDEILKRYEYSSIIAKIENLIEK